MCTPLEHAVSMSILLLAMPSLSVTLILRFLRSQTSTHAHAHACAHTHAPARMRTSAHTCMRIRTQPHPHTHTHTCLCIPGASLNALLEPFSIQMTATGSVLRLMPVKGCLHPSEALITDGICLPALRQAMTAAIKADPASPSRRPSTSFSRQALAVADVAASGSP